ncbi:MAG TPA: DUF4382 domain-containing protein [Terriglobia bacterium]|nr:DUF4382 domain-containing protein [Terriglobia bacterium]
MRLRLFGVAAVSLIMLAAVVFMVFCGGYSSQMPSTTSPTSSSSTTSSNSSGSNSPAPPGNGEVVVFGQDAPVCDVISFKVTITAATLTPENSGSPVSLISAPVTVDFARLMDFSGILNLSKITAGTYTSLNLTLADPNMMVLDVTKTPPAATAVTTTLTSSNVTVPVQPSLQVSASAAAGLLVHFDLFKSVQTDSSGQVTGAVTPTFNVSPSVPTAENGLGEVQQVAGLVQSVASSSTNAGFTGSFVLQTVSGQNVTVEINNATQFDSENDNATGLSQLTADTFVEVDAYVDTSGSVVAKDVGVEEQENANQHKSAFPGTVISVTRDPSGAATDFLLMVRSEDPDETSLVPKMSNLIVGVSDSTRFKITAGGLNEDGLTFDPTTLAVGQEVVVHGKAQKNTNAPFLQSSGVFLRLQTLAGNFAALLPGASGNAGGFTFKPCGPLFKGQPITVLTFTDTALAGVSGLSALTAQPTLLVKGLLFYQSASATLGGVNITAPGWVLEATQVHELNP